MQNAYFNDIVSYIEVSEFSIMIGQNVKDLIETQLRQLVMSYMKFPQGRLGTTKQFD